MYRAVPEWNMMDAINGGRRAQGFDCGRLSLVPRMRDVAEVTLGGANQRPLA
jgi:hypothetical protein